VTTDPSAVPVAIRHRVSIEVAGPGKAKVAGVMDAPRSEVRREALPILDPPFRGGTWMAANGPSNSSLHRRTLLAVDGRPRIAQRFAIDWIKLGEDGKLFRDNNPSINANWYGYGEAIVAGADGVVAEVKDGIPDNVPLAGDRAVPITMETVAGNHVIVEHGPGRYALYAHLQPGSLAVRQGDRVKRGQDLGRLGNSGNSDAPHVHFHLCDAPSPLGCEGQPYVMEYFEVLGRLDLPSDVKAMKAWAPRADQSPEMHVREIPLESVLARFLAPPAKP
jgi:hypothetical protein